jgi:glutamate dehydrogenase/leucine dehydrogenase
MFSGWATARNVGVHGHDGEHATQRLILPEGGVTLNGRVIVEGTNGPATPEADPILREKGALVVPDKLANVGDVTVSYF